MNTTSILTTEARKRNARTGLAITAIAAAFGITSTAVDLSPAPEHEDAATAIEYGLVAARAPGISFNAID